MNNLFILLHIVFGGATAVIAAKYSPGRPLGHWGYLIGAIAGLVGGFLFLFIFHSEDIIGSIIAAMFMAILFILILRMLEVYGRSLKTPAVFRGKSKNIKPSVYTPKGPETYTAPQNDSSAHHANQTTNDENTKRGARLFNFFEKSQAVQHQTEPVAADENRAEDSNGAPIGYDSEMFGTGINSLQGNALFDTDDEVPNILDEATAYVDVARWKDNKPDSQTGSLVSQENNTEPLAAANNSLAEKSEPEVDPFDLLGEEIDLGKEVYSDPNFNDAGVSDLGTVDDIYGANYTYDSAPGLGIEEVSNSDESNQAAARASLDDPSTSDPNALFRPELVDQSVDPEEMVEEVVTAQDIEAESVNGIYPTETYDVASETTEEPQSDANDDVAAPVDVPIPDVTVNSSPSETDLPVASTPATTRRESIAEEVFVDEPVAEESSVDASTVEELHVDEPVAEESSVDASTVEELSIDELTAEELYADEPIAEELSADAPIAEGLPADEPVSEELTIDEAVAQELPDVPLLPNDNSEHHEAREKLLEEVVDSRQPSIEAMHTDACSEAIDKQVHNREAEPIQATVVAPEPAMVHGIQQQPLPEPTVNNYPDDLTKIKGVGKVYARRLHEMGIHTWSQVADTEPPLLKDWVAATKTANVNEWPQLARSLAVAHDRVGATYSGPLPDDFNQIAGITKKMIQQLHKNGIVSYHQLADVDSDRLLQQLATQNVTAAAIYDWISQAKQKLQ